MKELEFRDIQTVELAILSKVASICEQENLRYFLHYGTLIGAIRHKGFIPWDDDLDIVMPRPDYEKLVQYFIEHEKALEPLQLMHYKTNKKYIFPIARISDSRYCADYKGKKEYGLGVFIDVYPFDGCGNSSEEAEIIYRENKNLISIISSGGRTSFEESPAGIVRNFIKRLLYIYTNVFGLTRLIEKLDKKSSRHSFEHDYLSYCTVWGTSVKWAQPRTDFNRYIYVQFENKEFRTFCDYDRILKNIYGDYMQLPPAEEQIGNHYYKIYKR